MTLPHISRIVLTTSIGFICGVGVRSIVYVPCDMVLFLCATCAIGCFFALRVYMHRWIIIVLLLGLCGGVVTIDREMQLLTEYEQQTGQKIFSEAVIEREIVQKKWYAQVYATLTDSSITVLINDEKYPRARQGDRIMLTCTLGQPEQIDKFDYRMYLAMREVYFVCMDASYDVIGRRETFITQLGAVRAQLESIVEKNIPSPQAALANGLLFGGDDRLSQEMQDQFARTGMTHIVAVSGYNVSIIIAVIVGIMIFCGAHRKTAVIVAMMCIGGFILLIGCPSSGVRAAVMGSMVLIAAIFGRVSHAYAGICFAAALMLLYNPLLLRYDVGFQLSFLATVGIVATHGIFEKSIILQKKSFGLLEIFVLTISAQIFVAPVIAYHFHSFALLSIIVNVLVLPIIPCTMLLVFLLVVLSFIFMPLATLCGWGAYFLLTYEIMVIRSFAHISWSSMQIKDVRWWWVFLYYAVLFFVIRYYQKKYEQ